MWNGEDYHHHEHSAEARRLSLELGIGGGRQYHSDEDNNRGGGGQFSDNSDDEDIVVSAATANNNNDGYDMMAHTHDGGEEEDSDDEDDDEDDDIDEPTQASAAVAKQQEHQPRGKPEAMAAKLAAAARLQEKYPELDDEEHEQEDITSPPPKPPSYHEQELTTTMSGGGSKAAAAVPSSSKKSAKSSTSTPTSASKKTPTPKKKKTTKKTPTPKKKTSKAATGSSSASSSKNISNESYPTMEDPVRPITDVEYENLEQVMIQFCRVPLLAEFSRPVSLLHPELMGMYSKIVDHPIDLGKVCRKIRRRQYKNLRDARIDTWRIFANCVKYHSHHSNKDAVPSFVSIALHLRDYFNDLWHEYMIPSDPPSGKAAKNKNSPEVQAFAQRKLDRKRRNVVSGLSVMTGKCLERACASLIEFIDSGGRVDKLDTDAIFGVDADDDDEDLDVVVQNLRKLHSRLTEITVEGEDYGIDELDQDVRRCYTADDVLENNPATRLKVANRLDRWIGKIVVPIHEATCRGVSQSSIWGCMAAAVWARESSKKPYWPALVLGIMAPQDQREEWHNALTVRNEARLPEKLRSQLGGGKRKAEAALKKQEMGQLEPQSYFLVEFLGTHEFIWVRESDIQENFDPADDPNTQVRDPGSKKKRASRSSVAAVLGSKMYASAVEEAKWALEEFELQLQDVGGDAEEEEEEDDEEMGYSYSVLCQSDDEADDEIKSEGVEKLDIDECNELLATNGLIDLTQAGRKNAKKREQARKKQKADAERKLKADKAKKQKAEASKKKKDAKAKERESKKELRDLEKKRKKRARERDRAMKGTEQKNKKRRIGDSDDIKKSASGRRHLIAGKRDRASAIVEGYLNRAVEQGDYKSLCLGGVMTIPAAMVDSSGIFGMALAFRAAAGELPMPGESGSKRKPWDAIKVDEHKESEKRCELLEQQIALLEKEIKDTRNATAQRKELAEEVRSTCEGDIRLIMEADEQARLNPLQKKKRTASAPPSSEKKAKKAKVSADVEAGEKPPAPAATQQTEAQSPSGTSLGDSSLPNNPESEPASEWAANSERTPGKSGESESEGGEDF